MSGNAYVGIVFGYFDYEYEYLQTKLVRHLEKGKKYCFSINVSLADKSESCFNKLNCIFEKNKFSTKNKEMISASGFLTLSNSDYLCNKQEWIELKGLYTAIGGEKYLTIGLYDRDFKVKHLGSKNKKKPFVGAYYYIDDVKLEEVIGTSLCSCRKAIQTINSNVLKDSVGFNSKSYVLSNINFSNNSFYLQNKNLEELDTLVKILHKRKDLKIKIVGHTDNNGNEEDNKVLSERRAKTVKEYLVSKGLDEERITIIGLGSSSPISNNETEIGRELNRRIEIVFE